MSSAVGSLASRALITPSFKQCAQPKARIASTTYTRNIICKSSHSEDAAKIDRRTALLGFATAAVTASQLQLPAQAQGKQITPQKFNYLKQQPKYYGPTQNLLQNQSIYYWFLMYFCRLWGVFWRCQPSHVLWWLRRQRQGRCQVHFWIPCWMEICCAEQGRKRDSGYWLPRLQCKNSEPKFHRPKTFTYKTPFSNHFYPFFYQIRSTKIKSYILLYI